MRGIALLLLSAASNLLYQSSLVSHHVVWQLTLTHFYDVEDLALLQSIITKIENTVLSFKQFTISHQSQERQRARKKD